MSETSRSSTVVKLFCPSLSQLVPLRVESVKEKLDLGAIARAFGIEPATLKLNGHFISRGADLISSSVTWKSVISFFAKRGLSTGIDDGDALIVDGKLCKPGIKIVNRRDAILRNKAKRSRRDQGNRERNDAAEIEEERVVEVALVPTPPSRPISRGFEKAYAPTWGVKINDSCIGDDVISRDLVLYGSTPLDRRNASQLDVDSSISLAYQAAAMNNLYLGDLTTKLGIASQLIASKDQQLREKEKYILSEAARHKEEVSALNVALKNCIPEYENSKEFKDKLDQYVVDNSEGVFDDGWDKTVEILGPVFNFTKEQAQEEINRALEREQEAMDRAEEEKKHAEEEI